MYAQDCLDLKGKEVMYSWADKKGAIHYSNITFPPKNEMYDPIQMRVWAKK